MIEETLANAVPKETSLPSRRLPAAGFLRLRQIVGDAKSDPPTPPMIPISKSGWWQGVKDGRFPRPVKLGARVTAWRLQDILELIERLGKDA